MIYTRKTKQLHKLYKASKMLRSKCLDNPEIPNECCWADYYKKIVKLIKLNISLLEKNYELTDKRKSILNSHLLNALKKYKKFRKLCNEVKKNGSD